MMSPYKYLASLWEYVPDIWKSTAKKSAMMYGIDYGEDLWPKQTCTILRYYTFRYDLSTSIALLNKALQGLDHRLGPVRVFSCFEMSWINVTAMYDDAVFKSSVSPRTRQHCA
jgi:hypothetical protein